MEYIENIIVSDTTWEAPVRDLLSNGTIEDMNIEFLKTHYTHIRFIPEILLSLNFVKSKSEVKRNKPELFRDLRHEEYLEIKWGKRKLWLIG